MNNNNNNKPNIKDDGFELHAGYRIRQLTSKAGKRYQVDLGRSTGKHIRLSFETLKAARKCAFEKSNEKKNHGVKILGFTDKQRNDAVTALEILGPYGINLKQAANFYAKHNQVVDHTNGTGELLRQYLEAQEQRKNIGELRERSYKECVQHLSKYGGSEGHLAIDTISATDIDTWLDNQNFGATSRDNHRRYISGFFNWCLDQGKITANPVLRTRKIKKVTHTPEIYSTKDVKTIFGACTAFITEPGTDGNGKKVRIRKVKLEGKMVVPDKTTLIPYMALAFFAGIRPNEITRLRWKDIDLQLDEIHVNADTSKTSTARIVHISANLKKWLIPYRGDDDALVFPYSDTVLRSWRRAIFKDLDVKYIQDGARHSFATYYLALNSMDDTIQELGHTDTKMLFKHYRGLAKNRKNQAREYFKIAPAKEAKIIPMTKAV
ncbi:Tyrosine recombinase XerC [Pontiella desulfatans]|uniref:Tyrosine recombinase XerC n=1 Tax=Pontiella desulfatans TaxID=2750659 RepID=A0A6C2U755_PONDE|nr:tyrosine-type recombinase/integrase [Pontiella desulfatans]VGO15723.1 Tyrosine recombinase XerC [Pontiella desulfatans]